MDMYCEMERVCIKKVNNFLIKPEYIIFINKLILLCISGKFSEIILGISISLYYLLNVPNMTSLTYSRHRNRSLQMLFF